MIKLFYLQHVWDIIKLLFFRRALWDLQAEKDLVDQEESRWVIFNHLQGCVMQTEDRRGTLFSRQIEMDIKWHSGCFSCCASTSIFSFCPFSSFATQGKQGEPGPSGKAGLPGTPVSYLFLIYKKFNFQKAIGWLMVQNKLYKHTKYPLFHRVDTFNRELLVE